MFGARAFFGVLAFLTLVYRLNVARSIAPISLFLTLGDEQRLQRLVASGYFRGSVVKSILIIQESPGRAMTVP
jgi:hypothetical protein